MMNYLLKRLLYLIPVLLAVSTMVFMLIHIIPGDPVDIILGERAIDADRAALTKQLNLDKPILTQYAIFLKNMLKGDFGRSIYDNRPVTQHLKERYFATLLLSICAMCFSIFFAIPLGMIAAVRRYSAWDSSAMFLSLIGISIPSFWLGPVLILIFSVKLGWLPLEGDGSVMSLIMPAVTLGAALAAMLSRMTRSSLIEELNMEYVTAAYAKGLSRFKVIFKHAFRNALNPIITIVGLQIGTLLAGTIIVEKIFSWPGIGTLLLNSINRRDYPLVEGCILAISFAYVIINALTDAMYKAADPRVEM